MEAKLKISERERSGSEKFNASSYKKGQSSKLLNDENMAYLNSKF